MERRHVLALLEDIRQARAAKDIPRNHHDAFPTRSKCDADQLD
jgi:hypothetical protein